MNQHDFEKELQAPNFERKFKKDTLWRYQKRTYRIIGPGRMKHPEARYWIDCIFYESGMSPYRQFARELIDFIEKFKPVSES